MQVKELLDKVYLGLMDQGKRSMSDKDSYSCAYRGANGTKCAVGLLVPDDKLAKQWDKNESGTSINSILEDYSESVVKPDIVVALQPHAGLLVELQNIHDSAFKVTYQILEFHPDEFRKHITEQMQSIYERYNLEMPSWEPK